MRRHSVRGDVLGCLVDTRPCICMFGPVWRPNVEGLATQQQVKRQAHLLPEGIFKFRVGIRAYPAAMREVATGVLFWSSWGLYDTIKRDKLDHDDFSHDRGPYSVGRYL